MSSQRGISPFYLPPAKETSSCAIDFRTIRIAEPHLFLPRNILLALQQLINSHQCTVWGDFRSVLLEHADDCQTSILHAPATFLPHTRSGIQTGSRASVNPVALWALPGPGPAAGREPFTA